MSKSLTVSAPAKVNLWLEVLGKRDDGYHEIDTRMVPLTLADRLTLNWTDDNSVKLLCSDPSLPTGEENLVVKAVRALERRMGRKFSVKIMLEKNIPSGAGLGGGSSDAASVLIALNRMGDFGLDREFLSETAAEVGSDVPFFIYEGVCDCRGRGEIVQPVENWPGPLSLLLIKPEFEVGAGWAYQRLAEAENLPDSPPFIQVTPWGDMRNSLEAAVFGKHVVLAEMKRWLLSQPEVHGAIMSGSGSTMISVLREPDSSEPLRLRALERYGENCWTWTGETR